jgi:hypothetical protein
LENMSPFGILNRVTLLRWRLLSRYSSLAD